MADYKTMYTTLFNATTDAIKILKDAQFATEELYITSETQLVPLPKQEQDSE
ncbi:MAG: hypothetical protein RR053_01315 [Evtepia sp.]